MEATWNGSIFVPRYASPRRPNGLVPPSPPQESRQRRRSLLERAVRGEASYTGRLEFPMWKGRLEDFLHAIRIGTPGAMSGGMQSLSGIETQLLGPNSPAGSFLWDKFTGGAGALDGHTPDLGSTWTNAASVNSLDGSGNVYGSSAAVADCISYNAAAPTPSASIYTVEAVFSVGNDGTSQMQMGPMGRVDPTGKTGVAAWVQGNGFVHINSYDWNAGVTTGVIYNSFPTAYTFVAGDTLTLHMSATEVWLSLVTVADGSFTSSHFAKTAIAGERAGVYSHIAASGTVMKITTLTAAE